MRDLQAERDFVHGATNDTLRPVALVDSVEGPASTAVAVDERVSRRAAWLTALAGSLVVVLVGAALLTARPLMARASAGNTATAKTTTGSTAPVVVPGVPATAQAPAPLAAPLTPAAPALTPTQAAEVAAAMTDGEVAASTDVKRRKRKMKRSVRPAPPTNNANGGNSSDTTDTTNTTNTNSGGTTRPPIVRPAPTSRPAPPARVQDPPRVQDPGAIDLLLKASAERPLGS